MNLIVDVRASNVEIMNIEYDFEGELNDSVPETDLIFLREQQVNS
jgi:hypothetical protein